LNSLPRQPTFQDATLSEAIRLAEDAGPLDDAQAMRQAMASQASTPARIAERARLLADRLALTRELSRARSLAPWMLLALVALIVVAGLALAGDALGGSERRINVVVAFAGLLGLHLFTLLVWLLGLVLPLGSFQASFGWLWLALTARVAGGRRGQAPLLLRAATRLLLRARLLPWALGLASHVIWTLSFGVVLAVMAFALAFRNYTLNWETTILDPDFFVRSVALLGRLPAALGFPVPTAQDVLAPLAAASSQRAWAMWQIGCVAVYGLLPRLAFALLAAAVCRSRRAALQPDLSAPYYRKLAARFEALEPRRIVDADPGSPARAAASSLASGTGDERLAIGFELPDELPWPPPGLAAEKLRALRIDGSAASRRSLLDTLAQARPQRVWIGCRAASSPDRGTERFLREVMAASGDCRLWLVGAEAEAEAKALHSPERQRWQAWLADAGLERLLAPDTAPALSHGAA
jgi:hypothetical protein